MGNLTPCYASSAKQYRAEMGGSADAANLPRPTDEGVEKWENAGKAFDDISRDIEDALRAAEAAHEGRAADAANASISEVIPYATAAAETSRAVKSALQEQTSYQAEAFNSIPAQGDTLDNGRDVQLDPPEKGWVENSGLADNPLTGWMSDYEDRQEDFRATNEKAQAAMDRYKAQTEGVVGRLPEFQPPAQPPPPAVPPPGSTNTSSSNTGQLADVSSMSSAPSSSQSSWAAPSVPSPSTTPSPSPQAPAGSQSMWSPPPAPATPPGQVRGPDGTLYRQNANGAWERQNPYNGRWAPSPAGGPPGSGSRGGMSGGRPGGAAGSGQVGAGGRAGVGGGAAAGGSSANAAAGARGGGAGGAMGGGAGARGGQQGEEDQEHQRPNWLVEDDDVWTNDMQRVAPPVLGDWLNEGK